MTTDRSLSAASDPQITDPAVARLAWLFREHPVWTGAMAHISEGVTSAVYFSHRPGEPWYFIVDAGVVDLRPGMTKKPDFVFRFSPAAIETLAATDGGVDDVAVQLFDLILEDEVGLRINAPFWRLIRHGHLRLVLEAGPKVFVYGAQHGITTLSQLRKLVKSVSSPQQAAWEQVDAA